MVPALYILPFPGNFDFSRDFSREIIGEHSSNPPHCMLCEWPEGYQLYTLKSRTTWKEIKDE